jgi:hypothetical protein
MIQDFLLNSRFTIYHNTAAAAFLSFLASSFLKLIFTNLQELFQLMPEAWEIRITGSADRYYTSVSMVSYEDTLASSATLTFPFFIRRPGTYYYLDTKQTGRFRSRTELPAVSV